MSSESCAVERVRRYIRGTEEALSQARERLGSRPRPPVPRERLDHVLKLVEAYVNDAGYYLDKGDSFTALSCVAYAEGLLDALRLLGFVDFEWPRRRRPKVLVGGVFEILHPGHLYLLRRARELGHVTVVVARDETVRRLKGREPVVPEAQRLEVVRSVKYVDEVILGSENLDLLGVIRAVRPDIVLLGPDQSWIERALKSAGGLEGVRIMRLERRYEGCPLSSTSEIIRRAALAARGAQPPRGSSG